MPSLRSLLLACCCLLATGAAVAGNVLDNKVIRIGTSGDYPPLSNVVDGKVVGIDADFASMLSQRSGKDFQFKVMPWSSLIMALQQGDIDVIMSGMSITPERAAKVDFTKSYFSIGQMAIIRVEDVARYSSPTNILQPNVRIGYVADTTGAAFVQKFAGMTTLRSFASVEPALDALLKGEIDCLVHDSVTSWMVDQDRRYSSLMSLRNPLTEEHLAWAVNKDQPQLLDMLNQQLAAMQQDGSVDKVLNQWIPVRVTVEQTD